MCLFFVDIGYVLLSRSASDSAPEMGPRLRNRTEEDGEGKPAESLLPKSLACNRYGLRGQNTRRRLSGIGPQRCASCSYRKFPLLFRKPRHDHGGKNEQHDSDGTGSGLDVY